MCINISSKKSEESNKMAEILNIDIDLFLDCWLKSQYFYFETTDQHTLIIFPLTWYMYTKQRRMDLVVSYTIVRRGLFRALLSAPF